MKSVFNLDSPIIQGLSRLGDWMFLNVLTIICCIPIVTAGAAITALYDVTARLRRHEGVVWRCFWKAFRSNFKKSTVLWILIMGTGLLVLACIMLYLSSDLQMSMLTIIAGAVATYLCISFSVWAFPLQARYENTVGNTIKNAMLFGIFYLPKTILAAALNLVPFLIWILQPNLFFKMAIVWLLLWYAITAAIIEAFCQKSFEKMERKKMDPEINSTPNDGD